MSEYLWHKVYFVTVICYFSKTLDKNVLLCNMLV